MKSYEISPQIINTMEISNEPREVKDSSSFFIYLQQFCEKNSFIMYYQ